MRTRNATLVTAPALVLALAACEGEASYEVDGNVVARQAEWDCEKPEALTLNGDVIAPVAQSRASGGSRGGTTTSGGSRGGTTGSRTSGSTSSSGGGGGSSVKIKKPKKVKISVLPDGQEALPANPPKGKKSCKPDYELYVRNNTGTFEQDVISEHYDRCAEGEKFPACTKGD